MKMSAVIPLMVIPAIVVAQDFPGMSGADIQKIQEMQACIEKVDRKQLKSIEQRQYQFEAEVKSLCESGKRDEAQKKAISFGQEMAKHPAILAMSKCGEIAAGMMPDMPLMDQEEYDSSRHVCDSI